MTASTDPDEALDAAMLAELDGVADGLVVRFARRYLRDVPAELAEATRALRSRRMEGVVRAAHRIVSLAGNVGALRAADAARELESAAAIGARLEAGSLLARLAGECDLATTALESLVASRAPGDAP